MSEANIRRLIKAAPGFETARVPVGYQGNVGNSFQATRPAAPPPDMSRLEAEVLGVGKGAKITRTRGAEQPVVERAASDLEARFARASEKADDILVKLKKQKGEGVDASAADEAVAKPFNELIELVKDYARESKDADPTVTADMAHALMSLPENWRDMVLRRAGNPEVFEPLRGGTLPEPEADGTIRRQLDRETARSRTALEDKKVQLEETRAGLPAIKKASSHFAAPDKLITRGKNKGKIRSGSKNYKNFEPRDRSVQTVTGDSEKSTQSRAIHTLSGDQIAQIWKIQDQLLLQQGYPQEFVDALRYTTNADGSRKKLPWTEQRAKRNDLFPESEGSGVRLTPAVTKRKSDKGPDVTPVGTESVVDDRLTIGSDPNFWRPKDAARGVPTTANVIEKRNRGQIANVLEMLDRNIVRDTATGDLNYPTVDLDQYFPWWRSRFAVADKDGNLTYPNALPSAEFVTGMIEGMYGITDPKWFDRTLPLIRRSIELAPDEPTHPAAIKMSEMVHLPSEGFAKTMQKGVGSPDYPYAIYGDRQVERPDVTAPERHPFSAAQPEAESPAPQVPVNDPEGDAAVEELLRLMGKPGLRDQSSIYKMPGSSPLSNLLA